MKKLNGVISAFLLAGFWSASYSIVGAQSNNFVDQIPAIPNDFHGNLSSLYIKEDGVPFKNGEMFWVTLPDRVKWNLSETGHFGGTTDGLVSNDVAFFQKSGDRSLEVVIRNIGMGGLEQKDFIKIPLNVMVDGAAGELRVTVDGRDSTISSGEYMFSTVPVKKEITLSTSNLKQADNNYHFELGIKELTKGSLERNKPIKIQLPNGFKFINSAQIKTLQGHDKNILIEGLGTNEIRIKIEDEATTQATEWSIPFEFSLENDPKLEPGHIFLMVNGNHTQLPVGYYTKQLFKKIEYKIGSTFYYDSGQKKEMDVAPYIKNNRTYLPLRNVAEALGLTEDQIIWNGVSKTVYLMKDGKSIQIPVGGKHLIINDQMIEIDGMAAEMLHNRVMVSMRYIMELFNVKITWEPQTQTIKLN